MVSRDLQANEVCLQNLVSLLHLQNDQKDKCPFFCRPFKRSVLDPEFAVPFPFYGPLHVRQLNQNNTICIMDNIQRGAQIRHCFCMICKKLCLQTIYFNTLPNKWQHPKNLRNKRYYWIVNPLVKVEYFSYIIFLNQFSNIKNIRTGISTNSPGTLPVNPVLSYCLFWQGILLLVWWHLLLEAA